jgi:hypothetical protein
MQSWPMGRTEQELQHASYDVKHEIEILAATTSLEPPTRK